MLSLLSDELLEKNSAGKHFQNFIPSSQKKLHKELFIYLVDDYYAGVIHVIPENYQ